MTHTFFLIIHITGGTMALLSGLTAAISRKGSSSHRKGGKLFAITMIITALSAIVLSIIHPSPFLMGIGFFTLYLTVSGWIWAMRIKQERKLYWNFLISVSGIAFAGFLIINSMFGYGQLNLVLLVFGGIQLVMSLSTIKVSNDSRKNIPRHAARIGGAYIAAVTAFLVVNVNFLPAYLVWLMPSVVGSVLITMATTVWGKAHNS